MCWFYVNAIYEIKNTWTPSHTTFSEQRAYNAATLLSFRLLIYNIVWCRRLITVSAVIRYKAVELVFVWMLYGFPYIDFGETILLKVLYCFTMTDILSQSNVNNSLTFM